MKRKEVLVGVVGIVILFALGFIMDARSKGKSEPIVKNEEVNQVEERVVEDSGTALDIANATYSIEGKPVLLVDGIAKNPVAPGSAVTQTTTLLEGPAFADVNADGAKDAIVIVRNETGGSGVFYYVASVLTGGANQKTTNSILLGDRIRIKEISVDQSIISVTTLERKVGEPMSTQPSVSKIFKFKVVGTELVSVE